MNLGWVAVIAVGCYIIGFASPFVIEGAIFILRTRNDNGGGSPKI